jgi:argininosuccinate synthase
MKVITGGVTAAKGFQAASTAAGIKYQGRTDMAMVYSEKPCVAAGTFTTNIVKAAPVKWDQEIVYKHPSAQVIVCNSGIANACTGEEGFSYCRATAKAAAETLNVDENSVLVASTGVIGMQLPIEKLSDGVKAMAPKLKGTLEAGNEAAKAIMTFEEGVPKTLNGKAMKVSEIITELNRLGGENGIGIVDIVENRVVGMKSRGVYETPGGTILMAAHEQLEELILDRDTMEAKKKIGSQFAQVVYEGKWFTPLREALQAFVESTQKYVTGEVKFKLYKGNIIKAGTTSPYSLYNESLASFTTGDMYDHHDADGFITLFGLPLKVRAMKLLEVEKNKNNK